MDKTVENLIAKELDRASKMYGDNFSSAHEAESVINEEIEETKEDVDKIISGHWELWQAVRVRDEEYASKNIQKIRHYAVLAISELIQVAAMCDKYTKSFESKANES